MPSPFQFNCVLPGDELRLLSMTATEGLSTLGSVELQLISPRADIAAQALLGQPAGVSLRLRDGRLRHLNGLVTHFGISAPQGRHFGYRATLRPWLWMLTRTADCRIFQDMSVPAIVEQVLADHGAVANYRLQLTRSYRQRHYCVQYRESDFHFLARLLEEEGIFWYFSHDTGGHQLVLADSNGVLQATPGCEQLPCFDNLGASTPDHDSISGWTCEHAVRSGRVARTSYDFERPSAGLLTSSSMQRDHAQADHEWFDFQGNTTQLADGQQLTDNQIDEQHSGHALHGGHTQAAGLAAGCTFALTDHPRADQNADYLCTHTCITLQTAGDEAGGPGATLHCRFGAMPLVQQFRPARRTRKTVVQGPQTAVVVGPAGEEIYTDAYGRVKVQFHWDRYGRRNETSSCWVRASSPWAGQGFGFIQVPRIGQEVVVDFLEGDPDQPIVTGRVYNAEQMPPWGLPANATQSGVLSRSSKGGSAANANEFSMEDKTGAELVKLHAERDHLVEVERDKHVWIGNDRRKTVDRDETAHIKRDRTETVDRNEKITVHGWRTEAVDGDETITIHSNRTERVDHTETISIGDNRAEDVGQNESVSIRHDQTLSVGDNRSRSVGQSETIRIGKNQSLKVSANRSKTVARNETAQVGMLSMLTVGMARMLNVGMVYSQNIGIAMTTLVGKSQTTKVGTSQSTTVGEDYSLAVGDEGASTVKINGRSIRLDANKIHLNGKDEILLTCGGSTVRLTPSKIEVLGGAVKLNC